MRARPATSATKRRKHHLGFMVFSAFVVGSMILAIVTVESLEAVTVSTRARSAARQYPVAGSRAASIVKATSRAVVGWPSCQRRS